MMYLIISNLLLSMSVSACLFVLGVVRGLRAQKLVRVSRDLCVSAGVRTRESQRGADLGSGADGGSG